LDKDLKNGTSTVALGVLVELNQRLAAITPDDFVTPPEDPEQEAHVVGPMTDTVKRSFTLYKLLTDECNATIAESRQLAKQSVANAANGNLLLTLKRLLNDDTAEKLEELRVKLNRLMALQKLADAACWADIKQAYPEIENKPVVGVSSDGNVYWQEASRPKFEFIGEQPPPEIAAMFEEVFGSRLGHR
jgi:hypothetical protein